MSFPNKVNHLRKLLVQFSHRANTLREELSSAHPDMLIRYYGPKREFAIGIVNTNEELAKLTETAIKEMFEQK